MQDTSMNAATTLSRTQQERREEARRRISEAALELFALKGFDAVNLGEIGQRAGYSRSLAQYHYPDKYALARELLGERMRRDLRTDLLDCPVSATPQQAWGLLHNHLAQTAAHYRKLHGQSQESLTVRGEMVLHQAALMANDAEMKAQVNDLTGQLLSRVAHVLEVCRRGGLLDAGLDVQGMAVFYVHSIWGLAMALFANPKGDAQIGAAFAALGHSLDRLRCDTDD
jgi:AcrR family transcriptional regulator